VGFGISLLALPLAALSIVGAFVRARRTGSKVSLMNGAFGVPALLLFVPPLVMGLSVPRINDVTTDVDDPPIFRQAPTLAELKGEDFHFPREFAPKIRESYHWLAPLRRKVSEETAYLAALEVVRRQKDWRVTRADRAHLEIEGYAVSRIFLFRDDFVVRVRRKGQWVVIDMRSRSRDGEGDFGKNADRIHEFLTALAAELASREGHSAPLTAAN
jgi:uncharacterized protein (DUF1499 family)